MNTKAEAQQVLVGTTMIARVDAWRERKALEGLKMTRRQATESLLALALKQEMPAMIAVGADGQR